MTNTLVNRLRDEYVQQSARCGEEDSQERSLLAQEAADEIEQLQQQVEFWKHAAAITKDVADSATETMYAIVRAPAEPSEPLVRKYECHVCGRKYRTAEVRDHHQELCDDTAENWRGKKSGAEPARCSFCGETKIHGPKCGYAGSPVAL